MILQLAYDPYDSHECDRCEGTIEAGDFCYVAGEMIVCEECNEKGMTHEEK